MLTPPGPPRIAPGPNPVATEGRPLELSCTSTGGSPDPVVRWYREGVRDPVESVTRIGNGNNGGDTSTSAVLQVAPSREDDGAVYRCVVWNRAMAEGTKFETRTTLSVNCKCNCTARRKKFFFSKIKTVFFWFLKKLSGYLSAHKVLTSRFSLKTNQ